MIAIIDYGVGNLFSLRSSLAMIGAEAIVTGDPSEIRAADRIILPGVGAFGDARKKLADSGLDALLLEEAARGKPVMGICLGMQMLFEKSFEYGEHAGLGLIPGEVVPMTGKLSKELKIPHIGWNALDILVPDHPLMKYTKSGDCVYFVHSFYATGCRPYTLATSEYGIDVTAAVAKDNVMGCQFHPEKSGTVGLNILKAFCEV
ncbi:MAG: imidazole glycerol phosphate synthase subunit HisH [Clostridia bacterium]|nr:imidazole glycerol phosphate synthase subunit HisH [Clostridia bacterium]